MKLHSREWGSGDRVAVLLHGMAGSANSWWQVGPVLAERGYRVVALDLPGHGHSPRCPQATMELFATSVLESVPTRPALAIGHSLGGSVLAAAVGRLRPQRAVYVDHPFQSTRTPPVDTAALTEECEASKAGRTPQYLRSTRTWWREEDVLAEAEAARRWDVAAAVSLWAAGAGRHFMPTTEIPSLMIRADPSENVSPEYAANSSGWGSRSGRCRARGTASDTASSTSSWRRSTAGSPTRSKIGAVDLELVGKRAIVTGGSRGIGLAVAKALSAEGAHVALVARDAKALDAARSAVLEAGGLAGGQVIAVSCDTGDDHAVRHMAADVAAAFGGVDILVNAAAKVNTGATVGLDGFDEDEFSGQVNVKVLGYLRCARAVAPSMKANGWGRIINISGLAARSSGSITGTVRNVAVAALTKNLADELGHHGVNVTVVHPGMTVTEQTPEILAQRAERAGVAVAEVERQLASSVSIGRLVTAEEVAAVVAFLASPKSVAVNGDAIAVGGGAAGPVYY